MIHHDSLRLATALAHTVPGVGLELQCCNGDVLTVAHRRLDAQLDPCQLRTALLASQRVGRPRLADALEGVEVRWGLEDLGGGLYRCAGRSGDERWFAALLPPEVVEAELTELPVRVPDGAMHVALHADADLEVTVVRLWAGDAPFEHRLDEVGFQALSTCMVAEALEQALRRSGRR